MFEKANVEQHAEVPGQPHLRTDGPAHAWLGEEEASAALAFPTVVHAVATWSKESPSRVALVYFDPNGKRRQYSYGELWAAACNLAGRLARCEVNKGDRVAVCSRASAEVIVAYLAILRLGAVVVPIDPRWTTASTTFLLQLTTCTLILCDDDGAELLADSGVGCLKLDRALFSDDVPLPQSAFPESMRVAAILSTSGTTAEPKAPCLSHRNLIVNAEALRQIHELTPDTVNLCVLPLFHANAFGLSFVATLYSGGRLVLCRGMQANITSVIREEKVSLISLVPELLKVLVNLPLSSNAQPTLRYVISAAAPLTAELARTFSMRTGLRILQGWGLSECTNFATTLPQNLAEAEYERAMHSYDQPSIGSSVFGCDVDIIDPSGNPTSEECEGELIVRGGNVMLGYWARPEYTAAALERGYLRTGDLGVWRMIAGRKMFFITGRAKELIIRCGEKISPAAVEAAMGGLARKYSLMAVGFPNQHVGEEIGLYIQAEYTPSFVCELQEVLSSLGETLKPRAILVGSMEVPRTSTGKPQRAKLMPMFSTLAEHAHLYRRPMIKQI